MNNRMNVNNVDAPSESKQDADESAIDNAPVDNQNSNDSKLGEDESKKPESSNALDYAALYEAELAKRKRAEDKVVKLKKQSKSDVEIEDQDDEEDVSEDRVEKLVLQQVTRMKDQLRSEVIESEVDDLIQDISSDVNEQKLIKHIYENGLQKSGFSRALIREDLANAKVLANRDLLIKSNKELSEALRSKATLSTARPSSSATRQVDKPEPQYSEADKKLLARISVLKQK